MTIRPLPDFLLAGDAALGLGQAPDQPPLTAGTNSAWRRHHTLPPLPHATSHDQPSADAQANLSWQYHVLAGRIGGG